MFKDPSLIQVSIEQKKLQAVVGYHWFFRGFSCLAQESFKYTRED